MPEVIAGFAGGEASSERVDPAIEPGNGSLGDFAKECLELAELS